MSVAPWSYSRIKAFEQCPKQFYHMKIAKDYKEPYTEAMRYGTELHAVAETSYVMAHQYQIGSPFSEAPWKHLDVDRVTSLQKCVWV